MSPTERSLKYLRDQGYMCEVVEKFCGFGKIKFKKDLFGFIDIIGVKGFKTIGIQATGGFNLTSRLKKMQSDELKEKVLTWVSSPARGLEIHDWRKRKVGQVKWHVVVKIVTILDL